jgi:small GTP-binding protein
MKKNDNIKDIDTKKVNVFKVILLGESETGKSSLLLRYKENEFRESHDTTIGVDLQSKHVIVDDHTVKLMIWDTAGQERFRTIIKAYYRKVGGVILLFDLSCKKSLEKLDKWLLEVYDQHLSCCPIILVGTKCDLQRQVSGEEINIFIQTKLNNFNVSYFESSAKTGHNIHEIFKELARKMIYSEHASQFNRQDAYYDDDIIDFTDNNKFKPSCCFF